MGSFGLVELQRPHEPFEDALGDAGGVAAFELGVVLDADPGEQSHLLTAQSGHPAVSAVGRQSGLLGGDPRSA